MCTATEPCGGATRGVCHWKGVALCFHCIGCHVQSSSEVCMQVNTSLHLALSAELTIPILQQCVLYMVSALQRGGSFDAATSTCSWSTCDYTQIQNGGEQLSCPACECWIQYFNKMLCIDLRCFKQIMSHLKRSSHSRAADRVSTLCAKTEQF